jgi:2,4-dienoyl-CoA reductase-like NADH-dependent reductase (Old Yellow Enzyme family)
VGLRREGDDPDAPLVVDDPGPAIALLARGEADMLAVGRMLIANPSWAHMVRDGDWRALKPYDHGLLATLD